MTKRISIVLPTELVKEIDLVAGPRKRSEFIAKAIEKHLLHERQRRAFDETAGILKDYDFPDWETPEKHPSGSDGAGTQTTRGSKRRSRDGTRRNERSTSSGSIQMCVVGHLKVRQKLDHKVVQVIERPAGHLSS